MRAYVDGRVDRTVVAHTIQMGGDLFDCVPIALQPSVVALRDAGMDIDARIQRSLERTLNVLEEPEPKQTVEEGAPFPGDMQEAMQPIVESCDEGTIPIRRIPLSEVAEYGTLEAYLKKPAPQQGGAIPHEYGTVRLSATNWGARAFINVWSPSVRQVPEFSLSQIWIARGSQAALTHESVEAGVITRSTHAARLFIYFTNNSYLSTAGNPGACTHPTSCSCWNNDCGFVQTNSSVLLDGSLTSSISGGTQRDREFMLVKQGGDGGDWHFRYGSIDVGFWPREMFDQIDDNASRMTWGGEIVNSTQVGVPPFHTTTHMGGDGTFGSNPDRWTHAAYQRLLTKITTEPFDNVVITHSAVPTINAPNDAYLDNCYDTYLTYSSDSSWRNYMFHGGIGWHTSGSTSNWCACGNGICQSPETASNCPQDC